MKEWKIGEIRQINNEWYQCMEGNSCENCAFKGRKCYLEGGTDDPIGECCYDRRKDNKSVIFKKLEKVGEPYYSKYLGKSYQRYKTYIPAVGNNFKIRIEPVEHVSRTEIYVELKQKEDMEEKNNGNTPLNVLTDKYVNGDICYDDFEKGVKALYSCKEGIKPTLKEFDLEAAKSGKPVCTRDGRKARIICFDYKGDTNAYPILALISTSNLSGVPSEIIAKYTEDGKYAKYNNVENDEDLMMLPEKKEGWINVYRLNTCYKTKEEAEANIDRDYENEYVRTVKITWEE